MSTYQNCLNCQEVHASGRFMYTERHSVYFSHPILKCRSSITGSVHYHTDIGIGDADTLAGIRRVIKENR